MRSKSGALLILVTAFVLLGLGLSYFWAQAVPLQPEGTTIIVNTAIDLILDDGLCSLREAIQAANTDSAVTGCNAGQGADIILLASANYDLTISGADEEAAATGDLDITDDLEIKGQGTALTFVSGNGIDRVFHVDPTEKGVQVKFVDLTIQNGDAIRDVVEVDIKGGGGILTHSDIILERVNIENNQAHRGGGIRITSLGQATISNVVIKENFADREGGGIYGDGSMDLDRVEIHNNEATRGGGVFCDRNCNFWDVSISNNLAPRGGGVYNDHFLNLTNVIIDHNGENNGVGGGVYNQAEITLENTTLSSNIAAQGSGFYSEDTAYFKNVTVYQNWSNVGGPGFVNTLGSELEIVNTIIANDYGQPNCDGDFTSLGYNLSNDSSCDLTHPSDIQDIEDPLLGALSDNGGETLTHALQFGSAAVDAGNNRLCLPYDQRYYSRPSDGNQDDVPQCDIGAYELAPGGALQFNPKIYSVEENVGSVQLAVERIEGVAGVVSVDYFTWEEFAPDKANRNADYVHTYGTLTWADGDNSIKTITVPIIDDYQSYEMDEIFSVMLHSPTGGAGVVDANRLAIVTILENDIGFPPATPVPEPDRVYFPEVQK